MSQHSYLAMYLVERASAFATTELAGERKAAAKAA